MRIERPPSLEEKREVLYERIERKLDFMEELFDFVQTEPIDSMTKEEFSRGMDEYLSKTELSFPEATEKEKEVKKLEEESQKIENRLSEATEKEWGKLFATGEEIGEQIWKKTDNDVRFIRCLRKGVDGLKRKKEQFDEIKKGFKEDKDIIKFLPQDYQEIMEEKNIRPSQILFQKLSTNLILKEKDFSLLPGGKISVGGFHIGDTIFNFIRERENKIYQGRTLNHEIFHNLSESFLPPHPAERGMAELYKNKLKYWEKFTKSKYPEFISEQERKLAETIGSSFSDNCHSEILSDLYASRQRETGLSHRRDWVISEIKKITDQEKKRNPSLKTELEKMANNNIDLINKSYKKTRDRLNDILFIAEETNRVKRVQMALILFTPSKFYQIESLLSREIGKDTCQFYKILGPVLEKEHFELSGKEKMLPGFSRDFLREKEVLSIDKLRQLGKLRLEDIKVGKDLKSELKETIEDEYFMIAESIASVAELSEYKDLLERFLRNIEVVPSKDFGKRLDNGFLYSKVIKNVEEGSEEKIENIFKEWPSEKREILEEVIEAYFANGLVFEDYKDKYTPRTIKNSPLWKILENFGLEKTATQALKERRG